MINETLSLPLEEYCHYVELWGKPENINFSPEDATHVIDLPFIRFVFLFGAGKNALWL